MSSETNGERSLEKDRRDGEGRCNRAQETGKGTLRAGREGAADPGHGRAGTAPSQLQLWKQRAQAPRRLFPRNCSSEGGRLGAHTATGRCSRVPEREGPQTQNLEGQHLVSKAGSSPLPCPDLPCLKQRVNTWRGLGRHPAPPLVCGRRPPVEGKGPAQGHSWVCWSQRPRFPGTS